MGGDGDDTLIADRGWDVLKGRSGNDLLMIYTSITRAVIEDFKTGDKIRMDRVFSNFSQVLAASTQVGADVKIQVDHDSEIYLKNYARYNLKASDFLLNL
jgi:Ca2+-binding RTX toxin-like protein